MNSETLLDEANTGKDVQANTSPREELIFSEDALIRFLTPAAVRGARSVTLTGAISQEDVAQEALMHVMCTVRGGRSLDSIEKYTNVAARNGALSVTRRRGYTNRSLSTEYNTEGTPINADWLTDPKANTEKEAIEYDSRELQSLFDAAKVPDKFRESIFLFHIYGLPCKEIAKMLNIPEATVRTRINKGLSLLRNEFGVVKGETPTRDLFAEL